MARMTGQRVAVIGGTSGIGFAVAACALEEGADVVVGSSDANRVAAAAERLGGGSGHVVDVNDEDSVSRFFAAVGSFDHLVYTAGDWGHARNPQVMAELDLASIRQVFGVRYLGAIAAVKHAVAHLSENGSITVTNGAIAHRPRPGAAVTSSMAGAVEHLTRALSVDLAPIRVNCVCPGYVVTEVWDSMPEEARQQFLAEATAGQPLPRACEPVEVAQAYLYAMCGTYTTGQVLVTDGGMTQV